jgi:hypothetical protein
MKHRITALPASLRFAVLGLLVLLGVVASVTVFNWVTSPKPLDRAAMARESAQAEAANRKAAEERVAAEKAASERGASIATPQLAFLSSRGYESEGGGYYIVEGQVRNISGSSLKDIEAVASWYAADGTFITSDSAIIEYNPILPGQTSPFKAMSTANPKMAKYAVEFKLLFGPTVETVDQRKTK